MNANEIVPIGFQSFPKIARFNRDIIITEKIDGTNAQVLISEVHTGDGLPMMAVDKFVAEDGKTYGMFAGSRNRLLASGKDNFGFAAWVQANATELRKLGPGRHFGEWWGSGIQRGYGLQKGDKRFSLFNVTRWADAIDLPTVVSVVPLIYSGPLFMAGGENAVDFAMRRLEFAGSEAAPGFKPPEGVVIYHTHGNHLYKVTTEGDEHKGQAA